MNKQDLENRVNEIMKAAETAFANYHALVGRLNEAKFILEEFQKQEILASAQNPSDVVSEVVSD